MQSSSPTRCTASSCSSFVHRATGSRRGTARSCTALDILWSAALTFVSEAVPVSPFFLFFLFVQLAAAYRWGFRATVLTTAVTVASSSCSRPALTACGTLVGAPWRDLETNRTILRVTYFVLTGCLIGYLAEQEKELRAEIAAVADAARQPRVELGLGGSVTAVSRELLRTFDAAAVDVVLQDFETRRTMLWRVERHAREPVVATGVQLELDPTQQAAWLFDDPGRAWHARLGGG